MDWRQREAMRFYTGEYKEIPPLPAIAHVEFYHDHFLHLSNTALQDCMIAFTESEEKGKADRQTRMKFGRYLRRFITGLDDTVVERAVTELRVALKLEAETAANSVPKLLFATDRATINRIFETCMSAKGAGDTYSCMWDRFTHWEDRPYHVYAGSPDVAVAYLEQCGKIIARTVVSTKDAVWVRCYAPGGSEVNCKILEDELEKVGYARGSLEGNRLSNVGTRNGGVILPYIDCGGMGVYDDGSYWVVCDPGSRCCEYTADCTDGSASPANKCDGCGRHQDYCECIYCECCGESYPDGCGVCNMCEHCERCITHERCQCGRCSECGNRMDDCECERCTRCSDLIDDCGCDRCPRCGDLIDDCECERCDECGRLTDNCECEEDEETVEETVEEREDSVNEPTEHINAT